MALHGHVLIRLVFACPAVDVVEDKPSMRQVETAEAKRYAASIGALVVEASAKSGKNVSEMFDKVRDRQLANEGE